MGMPETGKIRDVYFSLWTLTDEGLRNSDTLDATIRTASAMIQDAGAECHFYVTVGGSCDFIGVAHGKGKELDETTIVAIQHAIKAFGTLRTEFIKAREFSLNDFTEFLKNAKRLRNLKARSTRRA